jgi:hypothetical protein
MTMTNHPSREPPGRDHQEYVERSSSLIPFVLAVAIAAIVIVFGFPSIPKRDRSDTNNAGPSVRTVAPTPSPSTSPAVPTPNPTTEQPNSPPRSHD